VLRKVEQLVKMILIPLPMDVVEVAAVEEEEVEEGDEARHLSSKVLIMAQSLLMPLICQTSTESPE
jgi:hypothetical protein